MKRRVVAVLAVAGMVVHANAVLRTTFAVNPGDAADAADVFTIYADGTPTSVAGGAPAIDTTGALTNDATGSFSWTWTAVDLFDANVFTGRVGTGWAYNGSAQTLGPKTVSDASINTVGSEAVIMQFNLGGLTNSGAMQLKLDLLHLQNNGAGRVSFYDSSKGTSVQLTGSDPGQIPVASGSDVDQVLNVFVDDGDMIAVWRAPGSGQLRFRGFQFSMAQVTTATDTPANLTAMAAPSRILLDWDDDSSGYPLDHYTVYRGTASGTNNYVFSTNVAVSTFFDLGVAAGTTYYYAVTSTGTNGIESAFSTEVSAVPTEVSTNIVLLGHLDASAVGSLTLSNGNQVASWADQTTNGYDAVTDLGTNLYPSTAFESGLTGVDFGIGVNRMEWIPSLDSDAFLDQTLGNGFAVLVAFKAGTTNSPDWNDIIGSTSAVDGGFGMRYNGSGTLQLYMKGGAVEYRNKANGAVVNPGDTVVLAVNYDASTGMFDFWDSKNNNSKLGYVAPADFSTGDPIRIGMTSNLGRQMIGSIGEIKVYANVLSDAEFKAQRDALVAKWGATPGTPYEQWYNSWGQGVDIGGPGSNPDQDGVPNWLEYALNGDPTNSLNTGTAPEFMGADGGFVMVHPRPAGDTNLIYSIIATDDLVYGSWVTNEAFVSMSTHVTGGAYNTITNVIDSTSPQRFMYWTVGFNQ